MQAFLFISVRNRCSQIVVNQYARVPPHQRSCCRGSDTKGRRSEGDSRKPQDACWNRSEWPTSEYEEMPQATRSVGASAQLKTAGQAHDDMQEGAIRLACVRFPGGCHAKDTQDRERMCSSVHEATGTSRASGQLLTGEIWLRRTCTRIRERSCFVRFDLRKSNFNCGLIE